MRTWLLNGGFEDEEVVHDYVPEHRDSDDREKAEHRIVKDLAMVDSSEESEESDEVDEIN